MPNKLTRPLKELAALHSADCIAVLVELMDHAEAEQVRLAAANALLDRGHGRPRQEIDENDDGRVTIIVQGSTPRPVLEVRPALEHRSHAGGDSNGEVIFSSRTS